MQSPQIAISYRNHALEKHCKGNPNCNLDNNSFVVLHTAINLMAEELAAARTLLVLFAQTARENVDSFSPKTVEAFLDVMTDAERYAEHFKQYFGAK